jgi:hypothetical protein
MVRQEDKVHQVDTVLDIFEVQRDVDGRIVRLTEGGVVAADVRSSELVVIAFDVRNDFVGSAAAVFDDLPFERCDEGVIDGVDELVSDGVADRIVFHTLRQSDVVEAEVLIHSVLGYPCVLVWVRRLIGLSEGDAVEGEEFGVCLNDCHPGISAGWESAVNARKIFEHLGFETDDF